MKSESDGDLFVKCMKMLENNGVIDHIETQNVGVDDDVLVDVFRVGYDDKPFMSVIFNEDGNFDHER